MQSTTLNSTIRKAQDRGLTQIDWLTSYHSFSFGDYHDPNHMGFSDLRIINDDIVAPGGGFATHGHRDMEILTFVLSGELAHKDSMGNGSIIRAGDVQRMSAGTGVTHSEHNGSHTQPVHLLQIWVLPNQKGLPPSYEQIPFAAEEKQNKWCLIASQEGREGSVTMHQDISIYASLLAPQQTIQYTLETGRSVWLHVATGQVEIAGEIFDAGDAIAFVTAQTVSAQGVAPESELLLFDLVQK